MRGQASERHSREPRKARGCPRAYREEASSITVRDLIGHAERRGAYNATDPIRLPKTTKFHGDHGMSHQKGGGSVTVTKLGR